MNRISLILLLACFFLQSPAQNKIALVAGAQSSNIIEKNNLPIWSYNGSMPDWDAIRKDYSPRISFHAGMLAQIRLSEKSGLYFESGVIFYNKGRRFSFSKDTLALKKRINLPDTLINTRYNFKQKQYISYIDLPLNLVYKLPFGKNVRLIVGGGLVFSFFFNGYDNKTHEVIQIGSRDDNNEDLPVGEGKGQYLTLHYGINGSMGIEFKKAFLIADYSRAINSIYKSKFYDGGFYHQVIGVTIGLFLTR